MVRSLAVLVVAFAPLVSQAQYFNRVNFFGSAGKSMTGRIGQADIETANLELGHAISPRVEFGTTFGVANIRQLKNGYNDNYGPGSRDVPAIGSTLFMRRHFGGLNSRVRPFVELSSGPLWSRYRVPAGTSRMNFLSQGGVGVTFHPSERYGIIAGWRFGHISNGGIQGDRNPGYNINVIVIGVQFHAMPR